LKITQFELGVRSKDGAVIRAVAACRSWHETFSPKGVICVTLIA